MPQYAARAIAILLASTSIAHAGTLLSFDDPRAPASEPAAPNVPAIDRLEPQWTVQFEPVAWFVAPSGDIKLPVSSGTGPGGFTTAGDTFAVNDLNLDSTRTRPAGEVHLSAGRWRFTFAGFDYSADQSNSAADADGRLGSVELVAGDRINATLDFASYQLTAGYRIWGHDFLNASTDPSQGTDVLLNLYLIGGARLYDVGIEIERLTGTFASAKADHTFIEPIAGARAELEIAQDFSLDLELSVGYLPLDDSSTLSIDVAAGFTWRPIPNLGLQLGYRQLAFDLEDGDGAETFAYDGRLAGLFTGITLRF